MNLRDYCLDGNLVKSCPSLIHHQPSSTRFNKIAIQATVQMAADKEAVGLSRVHMYESKCMLPLRDNSKEMVVGLRKGMLQQSSSLLRPVPSVQSLMVFIHIFLGLPRLLFPSTSLEMLLSVERWPYDKTFLFFILCSTSCWGHAMSSMVCHICRFVL